MKVEKIDPASCPPRLADLLNQLPLAPLGPGKPSESMRAQLAALDDAALGRVTDRDMASACQAGLWLAYDFLDEAHAISQELHTAEGSYWHALMHRREPDFANSKSWFRQVGTHPVYESLREEAVKLAAGAGGQAAYLATQPKWDAFAFVDLCEANYDPGAAGHELCRRIQRAEWELLFGWCFRRAITTA
jgi:hypothetical protein